MSGTRPTLRIVKESISVYTATPKPNGDERQTLQPEGGREITEPDQNPKPPVQGRRSIYTATLKPKDDQQQTLQPEDGKPKPLIRKDLFLLENQLPYEVLDDIMTSATKGGANMRNLIDKFIDQTVRDIRGSPLTSPSPQQQQQQPPPAHLLQLLRNRLVGDYHHQTDEKTKTGKQQVGRVNELKSAGIQLKSGTSEGGALRLLRLGTQAMHSSGISTVAA
ncbi:hypothetical protein Q3G72_024444 [Acer saccharum]|nr:hypothetical protein Q3G72_024444 [Acer saccharum]